MNVDGTLKRLLPLAILAGLAASAFAFHLDRVLTLDTLRDNRAALLAFVGANGLAAASGFIALYAAVVALSLPGAAVMTLAGGFLFGAVPGAGLSVVGATIGAASVFLIARSALGETLRRNAGPFLTKMSEGFRRDAFNYLLFLRLVPAFPFWAVNLAPALLGVRFIPFAAATAIGIVPGSLVYAAFGAGLGGIFDSGAHVNPRAIFSPTLIAALVGLGFLALLPTGIRLWRRTRQ